MSIALSGGTTPGPVYEALARSPGLNWEHIDIFFADERAVARTDPASNFRLVSETLIVPAGIASERVHPMLPADFRPASAAVDGIQPVDDDAIALDRAARVYDEILPERLDILVLGLGIDGHIASLFPGSDEVLVTDRRVVPSMAPTEPRRRLTITPPVIRSARLLVLLATGSSKREALRQASSPSSNDPVEVPGRLARGGVWILDHEAAND